MYCVGTGLVFPADRRGSVGLEDIFLAGGEHCGDCWWSPQSPPRATAQVLPLPPGHPDWGAGLVFIIAEGVAVVVVVVTQASFTSLRMFTLDYKEIIITCPVEFLSKLICWCAVRPPVSNYSIIEMKKWHGASMWPASRPHRPHSELKS